MRPIKIWIGMLVIATGCMRAPLLRDAWRPEPGAMAVGTAIAATVATLIDPEAHRRAIEQAYLDAMPEQRPIRVTEVVSCPAARRDGRASRWSPL